MYTKFSPWNWTSSFEIEFQIKKSHYFGMQALGIISASMNSQITKEWKSKMYKNENTNKLPNYTTMCVIRKVWIRLSFFFAYEPQKLYGKNAIEIGVVFVSLHSHTQTHITCHKWQTKEKVNIEDTLRCNRTPLRTWAANSFQLNERNIDVKSKIQMEKKNWRIVGAFVAGVRVRKREKKKLSIHLNV